MNLLTLSLVIALLGEKTERQLGGEKFYHEGKIWKIFYLSINYKWHEHVLGYLSKG